MLKESKEINDLEINEEMLEQIPTGVGVYDVTDSSVRKIYLNEGYYQMIGASRDDRHMYDDINTVNAVAPSDASGLVAEAQRAIREQRPLDYRFRIKDGSGKYRWIAISANHKPVGNGTERFFAAYYDIDELVRTQEQLKEKEMLLTETLKYSGTTHFIYYPDRHRYEAILLADKYKKLPTAMDDFPDSFIRFVSMLDEDAEQYREMIRKIDCGYEEAECAVRMMYMGSYSWYRVHCQRIVDMDGRYVRAIGSAVPIDSYIIAERNFAEEKNRKGALSNGLLVATSVNVTKDFAIDVNNSEVFSHLTDDADKLLKEAVQYEPAIRSQNPETLKVLLDGAIQIPDKEQQRRFIEDFSHAGMMKLYESGKRELTLEYRRRTSRGLIWVSTHLVMITDPGSGDTIAFFYTTDINERMIYQKITGRIISGNFETVGYLDIGNEKLYLRNNAEDSDTLFTVYDWQEALKKALGGFIAKSKESGAVNGIDLESIVTHLEKEDVYTQYFTTTIKRSDLPHSPFKKIKNDWFYLDENKDMIVIIQTDTTEIFEQEREYRDKMAEALKLAESANQAKTQFLSRISHDIRTPLGAITSMTQFARQDMGDRDKLSDDLDKIETSGEFLLSLINDILDMSRIDSGKIELHPEPYSYDEFMNNVRNMFVPLCKDKGIKLELKENRNDASIMADKVRLNQIMLNMVSNAVKYTMPGGTIKVYASGRERDDGMVDIRVSVKDSGIGMSREFQNIMFDPFSQEFSNPARPENASGTGLGLTLIKRLTDIMGGKIRVESDLGRGTKIEVSFVFPKAEPVEKDDKGADGKGNEGQLSGTVLLAEDNAINVEIALRLLNALGLSVVVARDGREAMSLFADSAEGSYAAVLMDIQMPLMNGYDAAKSIRGLKRNDAQTVPIIAMTADAFKEDARQAEKVGMNDFVTKPVDAAKFEMTLRKWIKSDDTIENGENEGGDR